MAPPKHRDFTAFYEATWGRTVACAYAISGELGAAEESAQEAYARAWPRWSRLGEYDDPDQAVAPAPLDATTLTEAFQGQVTWIRGNAVPDTTAACTAVLGGEAQSETTTEFRSGRTLGAARTYASFASASDAGHVLNDLVGDMRACNSRQVTVGPVPVPLAQGRGVHATVPANENAPTQLIWLVRIENRIGILTVVGIEDQPGQKVVQSVADALLAGTMD